LSPGGDKITAVAGEQQGVNISYELCRKVCETDAVPDGRKKSVIVLVFKEKGKLCCDNYRGISLLSLCFVKTY